MASLSVHEPDLLELARGGDGKALGSLLEKYRHYLCLLARIQIGRRLQRKVDEADLVQEAFLEAHRAFPRFRGGSEREFAAWLREILAARMAMQLRQYYGTQRRDLVREKELADELNQSSFLISQAFVASGTSPSRQVEKREQAVVLADALASVSADYRAVLVHRHLEGLTFPEIAVRMERSVDAVEKLWARALIQLRRVLPREESA